MNSLKYNEKKINFINRLKNADVYKIYEADDFDKIYRVLLTLKNKKLKTSNILSEKYKNMLENPNFEQNYWPGTAEVVYKIGHDSIRLMKWI